VSGTVTATGIRSPEGLEFAGLHDAPLDAGQAGVAAFPPSAVSVFLSEAHGSPRNSFQMTVSDLEPHGDQIRVRAGELSADVTPEASADLGLAPGLEVFFVVKAAAVAIYPA
jgi:molybdate transport system ATP-binding protein